MKKQQFLLNAILAMSILAPTALQAERIYKWTDDNGVIHYGDRRPSDKSSESLEVKTGHSAPTQEAATSKTDEAKPTAGDPAAAAAYKEQRKKACEIAKTNLSKLQSYSRIRIKDKETGEYKYLSDEQKQAQVKESERIVKENCD
ncbi:hypothetical protein OLMES_0842 [Oleiphilus messinensis]|uniref:DUF4124 domain-containing protein n=1 Tax=Oleiphilus messinensis TaxID=141451 RepID=A0A1Y0I669_9GAMM|nr:DUF4124 domain-containing protein [Oleiphilus messinensis]ARU54934.1 hypothetical protein OLMES_0842 [Oleiphilus messinensis]